MLSRRELGSEDALAVFGIVVLCAYPVRQNIARLVKPENFDLTGPGYSYTSDGRLQLESKDAMKKRGMPSPDEGDAVALCFSEPGGSPVVYGSNFNRRIEYEERGNA